MTTLASISSAPSFGASEEARYIAKQSSETWQRMQESHSLGMKAKGVVDELYAIKEECSVPGWDGYQAAPITDETYRLAYFFLEVLPLGTPAPSPEAEPDGDIAFEWYQSPTHTLSISVSSDGYLHYSALFGPNKVFGTEAFTFCEIPNFIVSLIRRANASLMITAGGAF